MTQDNGSLRSGDNKKTGQKYKNTTAFRHNKNSKTTKKILALPVNGLCQRCFDIIQWRKTYRKYKPLTTPGRCVTCQQKSVKEAYHIMCSPCAQAANQCAKCQESKSIVRDMSDDPVAAATEKLRQQCLNADLSERDRRTFLRRLDKSGPSAVAGVALVSKKEARLQAESDSDYSECSFEDLNSEAAK